MAYTKTITDANTYFEADNHTSSFDWLQFTLEERTGGFAQALRELELMHRRELSDPSGTSRYRDDYAHFEQILFILENNVRQRASETDAELVETADTEQRDKYYGVTISPMANRYMATPRVRIVRG